MSIKKTNRHQQHAHVGIDGYQRGTWSTTKGETAAVCKPGLDGPLFLKQKIKLIFVRGQWLA